MKKMLLLFMAILWLSLTGFSQTVQRHTYTFYDLFDASIELSLWAPEGEDLDDLFTRLEARMWDVHELATRHDSYPNITNVKTINENPGITHEVDPMLLDIIQLSIDVYNLEKSQGVFNIALGAVLEIWTEHYEMCIDYGVCELPDMDRLEAAAEMADPNLIILDHDASTIRIPEGMKLDLGGVAKGYGAELLADLLLEEGYDTFMLNAGGSNVEVQGLNPSPHRDYWTIGLIDPDHRSSHYGTVRLSSGLTAITSGDYERFFFVDGVEYHHLINPNTLMPARNTRVVTVVGADPTIGDIYSSVAFLLPLDDAIDFIDSIDGIEAIWLDYNREAHFSENFEELYLHTLEVRVAGRGLDRSVIAVFIIAGVAVLGGGAILVYDKVKKEKDA